MTVPSRRELREAVQAVNDARAALNARIGTLVELVADIAVTLPETTTRAACGRCGVEKADQAALVDHLELVHALAREDAEREAAA